MAKFGYVGTTPDQIKDHDLKKISRIAGYLEQVFMGDSNSGRTKIPTSDAKILGRLWRRLLLPAKSSEAATCFDLSRNLCNSCQSDTSWKVRWFVGRLGSFTTFNQSMKHLLPRLVHEFERVLKAEGSDR